MAIGPAHASSTRMGSGVEYAKVRGPSPEWQATDLQSLRGASDAGLSRGWRIGSGASHGTGGAADAALDKGSDGCLAHGRRRASAA